MTTHKINTISEALEFLSLYAKDDENAPDVAIGGELAKFTAEVEGKNYNASIPAELARGLWELQDELYRAVAFALYGSDSLRKLSAEQKQDFQLVFQVTQGSTDLMAPLKAFFEKLGEGFGSMESKHKAVTLVAIAVIMASAWGAVHIVDSQAGAKKEEIKSQLELSKEKEKTAQFELIGKLTQENKVAARFSKATEEGTKAIIKGASDANQIKVGKVKFDRDEIQEVNQRATKERAEAKILNEDFSIIRIEFRGGSTRLWLASKSAPEFPVTIIDDDFEEESLQKLWSAGHSRKTIKLEVNATVIRGQIRSAQIVKII